MSIGPSITVPAFAHQRDGVRHFFGTRPRVSESDRGWAGARVQPRSTRRLRLNGISSVAPSSGPSVLAVVSVTQVHGTDVLVLDRPVDRDETFAGEWDALVTNRPRVLLTVRTADCVPVLMHDPVGRVVAAVHAGWRGAIAGIVPRTLTILRRRFGTDPSTLRIGIGPSVGPCCYEVDAPVLRRLRALVPGWQSILRAGRRGTGMLDLRELVRGQAEGAGVQGEHIQTVRVCTVCYPDLFYSYRREGAVNGTMVSGIMLTGRRSRA